MASSVQPAIAARSRASGTLSPRAEKSCFSLPACQAFSEPKLLGVPSWAGARGWLAAAAEGSCSSFPTSVLESNYYSGAASTKTSSMAMSLV